MTRNEMIRVRRQMQRRIRDVVAERRMAVNERPPGDAEPPAGHERRAA
jgi:hypothetical protein